MSMNPLRWTRAVAMLAAAAVVLAAAPLYAENNVVSSADLQQRLVDAAKARQTHLESIDNLLKMEPAQKAAAKLGLDAGKVREAAAQLDDEELARLAQRADQVQADFAAGALTNQEITYILIALAAAVLVLILVAA